MNTTFERLMRHHEKLTNEIRSVKNINQGVPNIRIV
jgi:uncharacterized protein YdcH (DUF465 family)